MAEPFNVPFALQFSRGAAFIAVVQANFDEPQAT
jgi:hypothetical protein